MNIDTYIITCCGQTQSGKSTFLNSIFGTEFPTGDGIESETKELLIKKIQVTYNEPTLTQDDEGKDIEFNKQKKNLILVDVPGIGDTNNRDDENMLNIWKQLNKQVSKYGPGLNMVLFFYQVGQPMDSDFLSNIDFYKKMFNGDLPLFSSFIITKFPTDNYETKKLCISKKSDKYVMKLREDIMGRIKSLNVTESIFFVDSLAMSEGIKVIEAIKTSLMLKLTPDKLLKWANLRLPKTPSHISKDNQRVKVLETANEQYKIGLKSGRSDLLAAIERTTTFSNQVKLTEVNILKINEKLLDLDDVRPVLFHKIPVLAPESSVLMIIPWWSKKEITWVKQYDCEQYEGDNCLIKTKEESETVTITAWSGWAMELVGAILFLCPKNIKNKGEIDQCNFELKLQKERLDDLIKQTQSEMNRAVDTKEVIRDLINKYKSNNEEIVMLKKEYVYFD